jgi:hypothetical protein
MARYSSTWIALLGVIFIMLAFVATAASSTPSGHLRPNDRAGILGIGR